MSAGIEVIQPSLIYFRFFFYFLLFELKEAPFCFSVNVRCDKSNNTVKRGLCNIPSCYGRVVVNYVNRKMSHFFGNTHKKKRYTA